MSDTSYGIWCASMYRQNKLALTAIGGLVAALSGCAASGAAAVPAVPADPTTASAKDCCKGQNECKNQGWCKTDKADCRGHNECKGQGGCQNPECAYGDDPPPPEQ